MSNEAAATASEIAAKQALSADNRSAEDTGKMEWEGKRPVELEAMGSDAIANMSFKDIERHMGMDVPDRTDKEGGLANAPTAEIDRMIESGEATAHTEETLAALATSALADNTDAAKAAADADAAAAQAAADAKAAADAAAATAAAETAAAADTAAQAVQTRDGKGTIPYHVLENARARIAQVEKENAELKGTQKREAEDAAVKGALSEEDITAMRGEFPDAVVDALVKLNNDNIDLKRQNLELTRGTVPDVDADKKLVQDLIDQDPVLSKWQGEHELGNTTNWDRAVAFDDMLRKDAEWAKKPASERFDQVRLLMGQPVEPVAQGKTPAQLAKETADAAAAAATQASQRIAPTHSDLPGGAAPAQTDQSQLDSLSVVQLKKAFEGKTPEQIEGLLARFG